MTHRVFITGATGFVGGALAEHLVSNDWELVALVREGSETSRLERLGVTLVKGDLRQPESFEQHLHGCSSVFHCAALTGLGHRIEETHQVIADGTENLVGAACRAGVERFVYVSSILVYELNRKRWTYDESSPLINTSMDPYGRAKVRAESVCLDAHRRGGVSAAVVRPAFIYGPGDRRGGFLPTLVTMLQRGKFPLLDGGAARIPLVYISDLVDLLVRCGTYEAAHGQIYNACCDSSPEWRELVETLCSSLDLPGPRSLDSKNPLRIASLLEALAKFKLIRTLPISKAAVKLMSMDARFPGDKARRELGYQPQVDFPQGIAHCLPALRDFKNSASGTG